MFRKAVGGKGIRAALGIPRKPDACTDLKPDSVPR
jgi:hypothetical protein